MFSDFLFCRVVNDRKASKLEYLLVLLYSPQFSANPELRILTLDSFGVCSSVSFLFISNHQRSVLDKLIWKFDANDLLQGSRPRTVIIHIYVSCAAWQYPKMLLQLQNSRSVVGLEA